MNTTKTPGTAAAVRWLVHSTRDLLPPLLLACLCACLTRFASLGIYLIAAIGLGKAINLPALTLGEHTAWWQLILALLVVGLLKGVLRYAEQYLGHKVAFLSLARLRNTVYAAAEHQAPFNARSKNSGGLLAVATADVDRVEVFFAHTLPPAFAALVLSSTVTWWTWANFGMAPALLLLAGYLLVGLLIPGIGVRRLARSAAASARARGAQNQQLAETLGGIEVVHGFGAEQQMLTRFNRAGAEAADRVVNAGLITGVRAALTQLVIWGSALALLLVCASSGELAALVLLLIVLVPSYEAVRSVDGFILGLQDSLASARRLHTTALGGPPVPEPAHPQPLPETGILRVRGLSVAYGQDTVLRSWDLDLAPGELLALVGESGSGKSTAAAALVRAVPSGGDSSFGGIGLDSVALDELRAKIVLVSQAAVMVRGTIRENLLLGSVQASEEQLIGVLGELGLAGWLTSQKQGLDTVLGDRSSRLSGGQRQRLAVARALLRHPRVLILDESTSALDAASEQLVFKALETRRGYGMAVLMISHRISVLSVADRVSVLRDGQQVECGTPQELWSDPGSLFAQMARREADSIAPTP